MTAKRYMGPFGDSKSVLKFTVVMDALLCQYTKSQYTVNCMIYELYLSKAVTKLVQKSIGGGV